MENQANKSNTPPTPAFNLWLMAGEIGIILAVPLVFLLLAGIKLDARFDTSPLFTITGMLVSVIISVIAIAHKINRVRKGL